MDYDRQVKFLGEEGQEKLEESRVLIVGCGGLGSHVADILARSGVNLRLVDDDRVEETNLHRTIFQKKNVGKAKTESLKEILSDSSNVDIEAHEEKFRRENGTSLVKDVDVAVDCLDNMNSRLILNRVCLKTKTPLIHGTIQGQKGRTMTFTFRKGEACLQCLYQGKEDGSEEEGILGPVANLVASFQASEAIKLISGDERLNRSLMVFDLGENKVKKISVDTNKGCEACSSQNRGNRAL
ncbi:MAG: HesA/MoeB/ThiF family protein [Candidatus Aenigmatarchaeota archaeon]